MAQSQLQLRVEVVLTAPNGKDTVVSSTHVPFYAVGDEGAMVARLVPQSRGDDGSWGPTAGPKTSFQLGDESFTGGLSAKGEYWVNPPRTAASSGVFFDAKA